MAKQLRIYFIHSDKIDYNKIIYLPILRSNILSRYKLLFPETEENKNLYYKDFMDTADLFVVNLTNPTMTLNMELKHALLSKKPILALADSNIGYDEKYKKLFNNVIGYANEDEFRYFVETFVKNFESTISDDGSNLVIGTLQ